MAVLKGAAQGVKGSISNLIRGGGRRSGGVPPGGDPTRGAASGGSGGVISSVKGIIQVPVSWGNSVMSRLGPLGRTVEVPILGITASYGVLGIVGYFLYTRFM